MRSSVLFFLGLFALSLSGCTQPPCEKYLTHMPIRTQALVMVPKPLNPIQERLYDLCILSRHDVQVIRLGQTWKFIFPSDDLFDNDTAEINDNYKPILNVVADFMRTYSKISVKIASFSNKPEHDILTKFGTITDELTTRQANAVLKYFTSHHIDARLIYAVGEGGKDEVAWNGTEAGRRFNRRVEVSFRYYRDNTAWY